MFYLWTKIQNCTSKNQLQKKMFRSKQSKKIIIFLKKKFSQSNID